MKLLTSLAFITSLLPAAAYAEEIRTFARGDTMYIQNPYNRTVMCFFSYDAPNGVGGMQGDRRSSIIQAGQTVDVVSSVWNFQLENCKFWP